LISLVPWREYKKLERMAQYEAVSVCAMCDNWQPSVSYSPANSTNRNGFFIGEKMKNQEMVYDAMLYMSSLLNYNKETGSLTWKKRSGNSREINRWNIRYAGKECGCINPEGYRYTNFIFNGESFSIRLHRLAWFIVNGKIPDDEIDHINRDRADNRINNLRDVCKLINGKNLSMKKNNTSGITGVSWCKRSKKWAAYCRVSGTRHFLGYYLDINEAEAKVKGFRLNYGFTESHGGSSFKLICSNGLR